MDDQKVKNEGIDEKENISRMSKKKVFYIEDDVFIGNMVTKELADKGMEVRRFIDGEKAVAGLKEEVPDIVILDILIPGLNGVEVLEIMRKDMRTKKVPVLVISNTNKSEDIKKIENLGGEFIVKATIFPEEIARRVKEVLGEDE